MNRPNDATRRWLKHFRDNAANFLPIPWEKGADLDHAELAAIASSIQAFQLGESSEGRHLMRYAREWAARSGDADYVDAIRALIAEETRHARDLGRLMDLNAIPRIGRRWTDTVFRRLRNAFGTLEISIAVLVTAEIIAKVYYVALRDATQSVVLRTICDQILRDEFKHVEFQTEQLAIIRREHNVARLTITMLLQRVLFIGTVAIVNWSHRRAFARGGYSWRAFRLACMTEFARDLRAMDPRGNPAVIDVHQPARSTDVACDAVGMLEGLPAANMD